MFKATKKVAALMAAGAFALAAVAGVMFLGPNATAIEYGAPSHAAVGHIASDATAVEYGL